MGQRRLPWDRLAPVCTWRRAHTFKSTCSDLSSLPSECVNILGCSAFGRIVKVLKKVLSYQPPMLRLLGPGLDRGVSYRCSAGGLHGAWPFSGRG